MEERIRTHTYTITHAHELESIREEWERLVTQCPNYSQCQTPVYCFIAIDHALKDGARIKLITTHDVAGLIGIWALAIRREGVFRVLRPVGCGSDEEYSAPLAAPGIEMEILDATLTAAISIGCDKLCLLNVRSGTPLSLVLEQEKYRALPKRCISLMAYEVGLTQFATWEDYAAQASGSQLKDRRKLMRRLQKEGEIELGWCRTPADAQSVLTWIFETKARWARQRRIDTSWLEDGRLLRFFSAVSQEIDLTNFPMVSYLKLNGRPIAAAMNLVSGSSLEYFITTYDDRYSRFSPGEHLIEFAIKWCIQNHKNFDFRILAADYKKRIADRSMLCPSYDIYLSPKARVLDRPLFLISRAIRRLRRVPGKLVAILRLTARGEIKKPLHD